ncbi:transcription factor S [Candidatus Woesearchaeota archaeon]|nr:transcription factor S [Candidatus Woesearchaeota archaeon]
MLFCPECGSILRPKEKSGKKLLWCSCGFTVSPEEKSKEESETTTEPETKIEPETKRIEIVQEIETHPKIKADCQKCENKEAYYWTQQTRGADEPETRFFKCTKCSYTWREYS